MRRLRPILLAAQLLLWFVYGCGPKADEEPVWVGCVGGFGGTDKAPGARLRQGVALAMEGAVDQRVDGRRPAVVTADDGASDEATEAEAVRLLSVNRVAALIGGADAGRSLRLARAAQSYPVPVVLPCEVAGPPPGDAVFALGVRPGWRGRVLARYAAGELKAKHAALITDKKDPIAVELADGFVKGWQQTGAVEQETYGSDAERTAAVARAAAARPDVVLAAAAPPDFRKTCNELAAAGLRAPVFYGGEDVGPDALAPLPGDAVTATVVATEGWTEHGKEFARVYQDRFHEEPTLPAAQGFDAARLLFDAMARAKTAAGDKVRDRLAAAADFESLTGPLTFKDGRARRRVFVVRLHEGEAKVAQTVDPETAEPAATVR